MPRNRTFLGLKIHFNGSCSENHLLTTLWFCSVLLSMAGIVLPYFGKGKNETLTKDTWKNGCQLRYMEEDVNTLILHMGIHMMPLYILVTTRLDLENKEVPLLSMYLLVSYFLWEILHIKYNVCLDSVSWFMWSIDFNRSPCKYEDEHIAVILTDWHHVRKRDGEKTALKIKARNGVSQEKEAEIVYTIARKTGEYRNDPARGDFTVKTMFP